MANLVLSKLKDPRRLERIFRERLSEPLHLNAASLLVAAFGSFEAKVRFDLIVRQQHAFGLLEAARTAKRYGLDAFTAAEFGVANGEGLLNLAGIAQQVTKATGVNVYLAGFDTGEGMPEPIDYRDHPEFYQPGWYPMQDQTALRASLPPTASLIVGPIRQTAPAFIEALSRERPLGFVSLDVDYYSSTVDCLTAFLNDDPERYLPTVEVYADDVQSPGHCEWAGELLAIKEFNDLHPNRKVGKANFIRESRLFKNASWLSQMHRLHVFDHPARSLVLKDWHQVVLGNAYLALAEKP